MVEETVYKIALAAYLHDIGKFAERGDHQIDREYRESNQSLYQPVFHNNYTHKHALYTANFIEHYGRFLPDIFNAAGISPDESFINISAMHHKPESPFHWLTAVADRVSSGFDRSEFDNYNNEADYKGIPLKNYKKTRLITIFEGLSIDDNPDADSLEDYQYRYPLKELSPENIFSANGPEVRSLDEYKTLFSDFVKSLETLEHKQNIPLWFEHFDSLFMIYTSHIPAATVGYVVPDVSLYDHSRTTSALASALYQYHKDANTMTVESIKDYEPKKFLLVSGDFYGIQDFIFTEGGSTGKASAKLLRGRSFNISLLSELAADMLCRELGLPVTSIILNAAGKFTILAQNTENAKETVKTVESRINDWLIKNFFGQASMGFSTIEASCNDFVSGRFAGLWERLSKAGNRKKYTKFNLAQHDGCVEAYLGSFDNELGICPFCNKRPADKEAHIKDTTSCRICRAHTYIGENLVKETRIAITTIKADLEREKLLKPIFDSYQVSFKVSGKLNQLSSEGSLLKYWDIGIPDNGNITKDITARFLNGYVPKYEDEDLC